MSRPDEIMSASELITAAGAARECAHRYYKLMLRYPQNFRHILRYVEHSTRAEECELQIRKLKKDMGL